MSAKYCMIDESAIYDESFSIESNEESSSRPPLLFLENQIDAALQVVRTRVYTESLLLLTNVGPHIAGWGIDFLFLQWPPLGSVGGIGFCPFSVMTYSPLTQ